jgi:hypothetical protein
MTDPLAVKCPACLAMPGERCSNNIRELESVHWSRHWLARQRKSQRGPRHDERRVASARGSRSRSG